MAWSGIVILPFLLLLAPPVQRLAVRLAVHHLDSLLPSDAPPTEISIGFVGVHHRPFGIALYDVNWSLEDTDQSLLRLESIAVQPQGFDPSAWDRIHLKGARIQPALFDWLTTALSTPTLQKSDGQPPDMAIEHLGLEDIQVPLPSAWTSGVDSLVLHLADAEVSDLIWDGNQPKWSGGHVDLSASGLWQTQPFNMVLEGEGTPAGLGLTLRENAPGEGFPIPGQGAAIHRLNSTSILANLPAHHADVALELDAGFLQTSVGWSMDSLQLNSLFIDVPRLSVLSTDVPEASGTLDLRGPLRMPIVSLSNGTPEWGTPEIQGELTWSGTIATDSQPPTTVSGTWIPESGAVETTAIIRPGFYGVPHHILTLNLAGTLPKWTASTTDQAVLSPLDWNGQWTIETEGTSLGLTSGSGDIAFQIRQSTADGWLGQFDIVGRCAPLTLSESLELYGMASWKGEVTLHNDLTSASWWTHVDMTNSRWIPKRGFGSSTSAGAPLAMHRFSLQVQGTASEFLATLDGDFAQGRIEGPLDPQGWTGPVQQALASGGFASPPQNQAGWKDWTVDLTLLQDDLLERWSSGTRSVGSHSRLTGSYVDGALISQIDLTALHSDGLRTGPLTLSLTGGTSALHLELEANAAQYGSAAHLDRLSLDAAVSTGTKSKISLEWDAPFAGEIEVHHQLIGEEEHLVKPEVFSVNHASGLWTLDTAMEREFRWTGADWTSLVVDGFALAGPLGRVTLGSITAPDGRHSTLGLDIDGVPTESLPQWAGSAMNFDAPEVSGTLNGRAEVNLSSLEAKAYVQWQDANIIPYALGDLCFDLAWHESWSGSVQQFVGEREVLVAHLNDAGKAELSINNWPLTLLNPLLDKAGVDLDGTAQGAVEMTMKDGLPIALGRIELDVPDLHVDATGSWHTINGALRLEPGFMGMDQALVTDQNGHEARLNLSILHEDYTQWNYDLGIEIGAKPFKVMDLPPGADKLFHGTVFATGQLDVSGDESGVGIETALRSEAGTRFTLPLDALEGTDIPSGIQFVGGQSPPAADATPHPFDLNLSLGIEVTPDAELALVLDGRAGERVDGRASGMLEIAQTAALPLTVQGGLNIVEGKYRFSLRDLFTKRIDIAPGGRIDWDGDPYTAELDLLAFSSMRANPAPLLPGAVDRGKTRVEVGMGIRGALEAPHLDFAVAFPEYEESNPAMLAEVQAALATPEAMERQAFALLATGQFIPTGAQGGFLSQTAAAQASELVSSRISEWLSGMSEDLDIGLRYVPSSATSTSTGIGGEIAQGPEEAFELDLGLSLMNDRLQISGSLGTTGMDGLSLQGSEFRGGLDVRYRLTADGRWELQAYRLPESQLDEEPKQGIGAAYQLRFDRLRDLFGSKQTTPAVEN